MRISEGEKVDGRWRERAEKQALPHMPHRKKDANSPYDIVIVVRFSFQGRKCSVGQKQGATEEERGEGHGDHG